MTEDTTVYAGKPSRRRKPKRNASLYIQPSTISRWRSLSPRRMAHQHRRIAPIINQPKDLNYLSLTSAQYPRQKCARLMRELHKMNVWNDKDLTLINSWLDDLTGPTWPKYNNIKILFFYKSRQYKIQLGLTSRVYAWYKYNKNIFRCCSNINTPS